MTDLLVETQQLIRREFYRAAKQRALRLLSRASEDVDYIQDPDTGLFEGSRPGGGGGGGGGGHAASTIEFVSPNVRTHLDLKSAVRELGGKHQAALEKVAGEINRSLKIGSARETPVVGAWADGAENSVMMTAHTDWDRAVTASAMKGYLANQKSVLVFQQQNDGQAVLATFEAKGSVEDIHKQLLQDGIAYHTLVPSKNGATVHVVGFDSGGVDSIKKAAERYDSKVTIQFGRAELIGDSGPDEGKGSDSEQRDRARAGFERVINESKVAGSAKVWQNIRDRWGKTLGGKFQQIAEQAVTDWRADHPRVTDRVSQLKGDLDKAIAEGDKFEGYRDWYARHKDLAKDLFGEQYVPYFEKFLAATSINTSGQDNVNEALRATIHFINGGTFEPSKYQGVMGSVRDELLKVQHEEPLTGLKVVPFAEALAGNWDRAPADRHMKNLLFENPSEGPNAAQSALTEAVVGAMAKSMGWKTAELQAVLWCVDKSREEKGASAKIFDYVQFMRTQEARVRTLLAEHKTLKSRASFSKAVDDDPIEKVMRQEIDAWHNAQLLLLVFQKLHDAASELTPEGIRDALTAGD